MSANPTYPYSAAEVSYLSTYLQGLVTKAGLGTLPNQTAQAWILSEQGTNGDVLGVTNSSGVITYNSPEAGLQAAVKLIQTGNYGGIRSALQGGNAQGVAQAIVASSWNAPNNYKPTANGTPPITTLATGTSPFASFEAALQDWEAILGGVGGMPISGQTGTAITSAPANTVGAANTATGGALTNIFGSVETAIGFLGIVLIGIVFILVAGIITLRKDK